MKNYYLYIGTQWNDEIYFIQATNISEAKKKLKSKFNIMDYELNNIEEIETDCKLLLDVDNPNYEG